MRPFLASLFTLILTVMIGVTVWASCDRAVWKAGELFNDPWFVATFIDAYCGFVTVYIWVAYKERRLVFRVLWFLAIMGLGNMGIASFVLLQLFRHRHDHSWEPFFLSPQR